MKNKIFYLFFAFSLMINVANAEDDFSMPSDLAIIAQVSVHNTEIISQENNSFRIGFDLSNSGEIQNGIKYEVMLLDKETQVIWDEKVYPEEINLNKDEVQKKEIDYEAPSFLNGKYLLMVVSKNKNGFPFGQCVVGEVKLSGDGDYLKLDSKECHLKIDGESDDKRYEFRQGIDVDKDEVVRVFCPVNEPIASIVEIKFKSKTYNRTLFGKLVQEDNGIAYLKNNELSMILPKVSKPQAYDVLVSFFDSSDKILSNDINIHYVLRGNSATIQNATLDRNTYKKGDSPKLTLDWTGRADLFPFSRAWGFNGGVEFSLVGPEGDANQDLKVEEDESIKLVVSTLGDGKKKNIEIDLDKTQQGYGNEIILKAFDENNINQVIVSLVDKDGNLLDEATISIQENKELINNSKEGKIALVFIIVILILLLAILFYKIRFNGAKVFLSFFCLFFVFSFGIVSSAKALTFSKSKSDNAGDSHAYNTKGTVDLNKTVFSPGETIYGTVFANVWAACGNGGTYIKLRWNTINHADGETTPMQTTYNGEYGYFTHTAPLTPGTYRINFGACVAVKYCDYPSTFVRSEIPVNLWYTVVAPTPVNGSCGTRNTNYSSATTAWPGGSTLCSTGTASPSSVTFPATGSMVNWQCAGSNGGSTVNCSASRDSATINGSCGAAQGSYSATDTVWRAPYCNQGTPSPAAPTFPALGATTNWQCIGSGPGHSDAPCLATKNYAVPTVSLNPQQSSISFNNNSSTILSSVNVKFDWDITNKNEACGLVGCTCTASGDWSGSKSYPASNQNVSVNRPPTGVKTFTLTCANPNSVSGSNTKQINTSCDPFSWTDSTCNSLCGPGNFMQHSVNNVCNVTDSLGAACNNGNCPASTTFEEVRP